MDLITILLCVCAVAISAHLLTRRKVHPNAPPCIHGWMPWFGAAFEFGKAPLTFISQAREKYGPVFTVMVAGQRLTFITLHEDFKTFFSSKDVDFEQAVQEPVHGTASISKESFFRFHPACNTLIKGRLTPGNVGLLMHHLCGEFNHQMALLGPDGQGDLNELVRGLMYPAVLSNLLGRNNFPDGKSFSMEEFKEKFTIYDEGFEYGSQLPDLFLREWAGTKRWLLSLMKTMVSKAANDSCDDDGNRTLLHRLVNTITDTFLPNYALLMVWASLANAVPITFWALAFMLENPRTYQKAMEQVTEALKDQEPGRVHLGLEDLQQMPYIRWCILEAVRLRAPGAIARRVVRPLYLQNYTIPPGDMLMLSPYWAHRHPEYFPEPEVFKPERWQEADVVKNVFLEGFVAFGGGKYQCPGRWYAITELHMFVSMILFKYHLTLLSPLPSPSPLHLVGTQQPESPCLVHYRQR